MDQPPPIPVLPLAYAPPALQKGTRWLTVMSWLSIVTLVAGTVAIFVEVESVLVSGLALAIIGTIMLIAGVARRQVMLWGPGALHLGICTLFVALVNGLHWGPRVAAKPFAVMSTAYTLGMTALLIWQIRQSKAA